MQQTLTSVFTVCIFNIHIYILCQTKLGMHIVTQISGYFVIISYPKNNTNKKKTTLCDTSCKMLCFITITLIKQLTKA